VALDASALEALHEALQKGPSHPLWRHMVGWTKSKSVVSTSAAAWAEYWRGRSTNAHYNAQLCKRVVVAKVTKEEAEAAANVLRAVYRRAEDTETVRHIIDALVMAHANARKAVVYTSDRADFLRLASGFPNVKRLIGTDGELIT